MWTPVIAEWTSSLSVLVHARIMVIALVFRSGLHRVSRRSIKCEIVCMPPRRLKPITSDSPSRPSWRAI
jgi:hypothetical protein